MEHIASKFIEKYRLFNDKVIKQEKSTNYITAYNAAEHIKIKVIACVLLKNIL